MLVLALVSCLGLVLPLISCSRSDTGTSSTDVDTPAVASPEAGATDGSRGPARKITKIVFVDMKNACECTRMRCDEGWAALEGALETLPARPEVQRLYIDTEEHLVEPFRARRPIVATPALYFLHGDGSIADLLQGEVKEETIVDKLQ